MTNEITIFNIRIHPISKNEFLRIIEHNLNIGKKTIQNGVNASSINDILKNKQLRDAYNNSDLVNIDGMSMVWASRFMGYSVPERVACPDLAMDILKLAERRGFKVFFLGASEENLNLTIKNITDSLPNLKVSGFRNGYFSDTDEADVIKMINNSKADILLLGLPSPKKELFIENSKNQLEVKYSLGVGGFFDILSGKIQRAPLWMQNNGMEWIYRFFQEPKRMFSRYTIGNAKFMRSVILEKKTCKVKCNLRN